MKIWWISGEVEVSLLLHLCFIHGYMDAPKRAWSERNYPFDGSDSHWLDVGAKLINR